MRFGLSDSQYEYIKNVVITPLRKYDAKVYCFGSRARNDHSKFSDLDLMVEAETDVSQELSSIRERLSKDNFAYKVDLVELKNFSESYLQSYQEDKVLFLSS